MSGQQQLFTINGLVDTNKTVWDNLENLAAASAAYVTWDPYTEQYGVVINEPGVSIRSFTDDNIIGAINLTETPFDELYNSCEVRFPNRDVRDKLDTIRYDQPVADRFDNEPDNKLEIQYDFVNDPIQADVIALTELKQARVNKTISFSTDFTQMDLAAGDIIDVTLPYWGWDQELFRIVEISQTDTAQGQIILDIVAIEYDAEVYNYNNLSRYSRSLDVGLPAANNNAAVQTDKDETTGSQFSRAIAEPTFFNNTIRPNMTSAGFPVFGTLQQEATSAYLKQQFNAASPVEYTVTSGAGVLLQVFGHVPYGQVIYNYNFGGSNYNAQITTYIPLFYTISYSADDITYSLLQEAYQDGGASTFYFMVENPAEGYYKLQLNATTSSILPVPYDPTQTGSNLGTIQGIPNVYSSTDVIMTPQAFDSISPGPSSTYGNKVTWTLFQN